MNSEVDNRSENGDYGRAYREAQRQRRSERLPKRTKEILDLCLMHHSVEKKTDYQYRINGKIDLYPIHCKYHVLKNNKRGNYKPNNLHNEINSILNK